MAKQLKNRRINGLMLEQIMRDVLDGMQNITCHASRYSGAGDLQITGVERGPSLPQDTANIIPFPHKSKRG